VKEHTRTNPNGESKAPGSPLRRMLSYYPHFFPFYKHHVVLTIWSRRPMTPDMNSPKVEQTNPKLQSWKWARKRKEPRGKKWIPSPSRTVQCTRTNDNFPFLLFNAKCWQSSGNLFRTGNVSLIILGPLISMEILHQVEWKQWKGNTRREYKKKLIFLF